MMVRLKEVCDVDWGNTNLTKSAYVDNGKYLGVSAGGCDGRMDYYDFEAFTPVVSAIGANCGKLFLPTEPFVAIKNTITLNPHKGISGKYIYYALLNNHIPHRGGGQPFISKSDTEEYMIYCPTLVKQQEIVIKFDKVENLISCRKQQLSKLDELIKSRFIELFGDPVINPKSWETAPLSALIINANNGMARRGKDADGSIVLRLVELQNGFIDYSAPNRICLNETEKKRYELVDNDFLFARVNGNPDYVGRCAVFKSIDEPVFHNDHIIRVHFDAAKINGCFMSVLLNSDYGKRQMREQIKTSAGQYTISQDGIGAIGAILPPLELQKQFASFVEQTDKSKLAIQQSLEKLETLKKALMQKYFG